MVKIQTIKETLDYLKEKKIASAYEISQHLKRSHGGVTNALNLLADLGHARKIKRSSRSLFEVLKK